MKSYYRSGAEEPKVWANCDYCGGEILFGEVYYESEGLRICMECARRYAWIAFLERSVLREARPFGPL